MSNKFVVEERGKDSAGYVEQEALRDVDGPLEFDTPEEADACIRGILWAFEAFCEGAHDLLILEYDEHGKLLKERQVV